MQVGRKWLLFLTLFCTSIANATVYNVTDPGDTGLNTQFRYAYTQAQSDPAHSIINFTLASNTITLTSPLPPYQKPTLTGSTTIDGTGVSGGLVISGNSTQPLFFVHAGTVNFSRLTLNGGRSQGGNGGTGGSTQSGIGHSNGGSGGGALGAGGALFIGAGASVTATDISFSNHAAKGGNAGVLIVGNDSPNGGGGGGMLGGTGGNSGLFGQPGSFPEMGGGGGGGGLGGNGGKGGDLSTSGANGVAGIFIINGSPGGNGSGGTSAAGSGGADAGGGGGGAKISSAGQGGAGGGGGFGGSNAIGSNGGNGGYYGGGGGGGFIGGVGSSGNGGFGGGGGGWGATISSSGGNPGFGGGSGGHGGIQSAGTQGNGGSGYGGAIFVAGSGVLNIVNSTANTSFSGNTVTAGTGAANGLTDGADIYLCNISPINGSTVAPSLTFNVATGLTQTIGTNGSSANSISGPSSITLQGGGTLVLQAPNNYTGGTTVTGGNLQGDTISLQGNITNNSTVTFTKFTNTPPSGTYAGVISGSGQVIKDNTDSNTVIFSGNNTFTGGLTINNGIVQLGVNNALASAVPVTLTGTGQLNVAGGTTQQIGDLTSASATSIVDLLASNSMLTFGTGNNTTFAGKFLSGNATSILTKTGLGTTTLTGNNTFTGNLAINQGAVSLGTGGSFSGNVSTIASAGTLQAAGGSFSGTTLNGGIISAPTGTLLVTDTFAPTNAPGITNLSLINVASGGIFNISNPLTLVPNETLQVGITSNGTMNLSSTAVINNNGGLVKVGSGGTTVGSINTSASGKIQNNTSTGVVEFNGGSINVPILGDGASAVKVTASSTSTANIQNIALLEVMSGVFIVNSTISNFSNFLVDAGASVLLQKNLSISNGVLTNNGTFSMNGNQINSSSGTSVFNSNAPFTSNGLITGVKQINVSANTVGDTFMMQIAPILFQNFTINPTGTVKLDVNFAIPANATVTNSGVLNMNGFGISGNTNSVLALNSAFASTNPITNVPTINVNSGGNFNVQTAPTGFSHLTIAAGGTIGLSTNFAIPNNSTVTTAGTFNMNGNNLLMGSNSILTINGPLSTNGTITRNVSTTGYSMSVNAGGTFTVNNTVSGYTSFNVPTGGTVNLETNGHLSGAMTLHGTLNVNGGSYVGNINGGTGTINVNKPFTPPGALSVSLININSGGSLTMNNPITVSGVGGITINSGGSLLLTKQITGNLNNNGGILQTTNTSTFQTITGDYTQSASSAWDLTIGGTATNIKMAGLNVAGTANINGGDINVTFPASSGGFVDGKDYPIITTSVPGNMNVTNLPTPIGKTLLVYFIPYANTQNLYLQAQVGNILSQVTNPSLIGIATFLDNGRGTEVSDELSSVYALIDGAQNVSQLEDILETLVPEGSTTGANVMVGSALQGLISGKIFGRMDGARSASGGGISAGDMAEEYSSYGPFVFANSIKQSERGGVSGYTGTTGGFGLLADGIIAKDVRVGVAASYASSKIIKSDSSENTTVVNSVNLMLYGSAEYGPLFADGILMAGHNYYQGRRNIPPNTISAVSHYRGSQYGGNARGGFTLPFYGIEVSPMATLQYSSINTSAYSERDLRGFDLLTNPATANSLELGLGGRISEVSQSDEFIPEIHAFYLYDLKSPKVEVTSQFVAGGGSFVTTAPLPPRAGINVGASLTAKLSQDTLIMFAYDLTLKKSFADHSASFKFRWLF